MIPRTEASSSHDHSFHSKSADSAFRNADYQSAARGFFVFGLHIGARLAHCFDHLVKRDAMRSIATQRKRCRIDGLDRAKGITFDAGDLNKSTNRITCHAKMMLDADFGSVFDLLVPATESCGQARCRHRARDTDLALTANFGTGDRRIHKEPTAVAARKKS